MTQPPRAELAAAEHITLAGMLDAATTSDPKGSIAEIFGRYRVLGMLGVGGMGTVYRVWDSALDEEVALKMLRHELVRAPEMVTRFRQEVKLARRVAHRNVVRTYDLSEVDDSVFLTMEYVRGRSLRRALSESGPLSVEAALDLARQSLAGIGAAHAAGVLHCDLKPDNILLGDDRRVAITDFGISRVVGSQTGSPAGTPAYMAPEQALCDPFDGRADLYSFGAVLFEALAGRSAWSESEHRKNPASRLGLSPPDLRQYARVPDPLAQLISRLLEPRPAQRFRNADEVTSALDDVITLTTRRFTPAPASSVPMPGVPSLAVLPFTDAGGGSDEHLSEGLTEEVIDALSATRGLRVRPMSTTLGLKGGDPLAIGRELQVEAVLHGTVRRRGAELTLAVRLMGVADGFQLWARRFRCDAEDALKVADEVARAVAGALATELGGATHAASLEPAVLDLYLRARQAMRTGWDPGVAEAVPMLEQVLARNPDEPNTLSVYAMALARKAFFEQQEGATLTESLARVRESANRAVARAPEFGDTWLALANAHLYTGAVPEAARALREAVRRAPGLARAQQMLGALAVEVGRVDEGVERLQAALSIDPDAVQARADLARAYALQGRWGAADALLATTSRSVSMLALLTYMSARLALWAPGRDFVIPESLSEGGSAVAMVRQVLRWVRHILDTRTAPPDLEVRTLHGQRGDLPLLRAVRAQVGAEMMVASGELEEAIEAIRTAVGAGLYDVCWMDRCPTLAPARQHPQWGGLYEVVATRAAQIRAAIEGY